MMYELLFIALATIYGTFSLKVDYWATLLLMGMRLETPEYFLRNPRYYEYVRGFLFLSSLGMIFTFTLVPWYVGACYLGFVWLYAGKQGRKQAFNEYRNIMKEMLEQAEGVEDVSRYLKESRKSDDELLDITIKEALQK